MSEIKENILNLPLPEIERRIKDATTDRKEAIMNAINGSLGIFRAFLFENDEDSLELAKIWSEVLKKTIEKYDG